MKRLKFMLWLMLPIMAASCGKEQVSESELRSTICRLPMIYTVEAIAEVTVENSDDESSMLTFFGNRNIVIPVKANVKAGINLPQLSDIRIEGDQVYITLPEPVIEIESSKIQHDQIISDVSGFRNTFKKGEEAKITKIGTDKIKANLNKLGLIEPAQEQAELILAEIVNKLGYTVSFNPRPYYNENELIKFIKE